tara:strand:- start:13 stop:297 length:285 start_codon:yes stop_codon:yes gene_type:complete
MTNKRINKQDYLNLNETASWIINEAGNVTSRVNGPSIGAGKSSFKNGNTVGGTGPKRPLQWWCHDTKPSVWTNKGWPGEGYYLCEDQKSGTSHQ